MAITKRVLSGSTNGIGIKVAATAATGTTIHTSTSGATNGSHADEIWLYASNTATAARKLTIEFGSTSVSGVIEYTVPAEDGLHTIIPGLPLNNAKVVKAFATAANQVILFGFVNRFTTA